MAGNFKQLSDDEQIREIMYAISERLQNLSNDQLEKIVILLKSIIIERNKKSTEESKSRIDISLDKIRNSKYQNDLSNKGYSRILIGSALCMVSGVLFFPAMSHLFQQQWHDAGLWMMPGFAIFLLANWCGFFPAERIFKHQDRRYFLDSIRSASNCRELDYCGLFSYNGVTKFGSQSDDDERLSSIRVVGLVNDLRNAIYNDEDLAFTEPYDPPPR